MIRAVFFDMDGVIVDSEHFALSLIHKFFRNLNVDVTYDRLHYFLGSFGQKEIWEKVLGGIRIPYQIDELNSELNDYVNKFPVPYDQCLMNNVSKTLSELKRRNYKLIITSNNSRFNIERMISMCRLDGLFDGIISEEAVERRKPDPDIYLKAIALAAHSKEECIAVEDSTHGILAAKNAGLKVIAQKDDRYGFIQNNADYFIEDLSNVIGILEDLSEKAQ
jgi:HAD superfamily hydrolase (TIGR01509 family)